MSLNNLPSPRSEPELTGSRASGFPARGSGLSARGSGLSKAEKPKIRNTPKAPKLNEGALEQVLKALQGVTTRLERLENRPQEASDDLKAAILNTSVDRVKPPGFGSMLRQAQEDDATASSRPPRHAASRVSARTTPHPSKRSSRALSDDDSSSSEEFTERRRRRKKYEEERMAGTYITNMLRDHRSVQDWLDSAGFDRTKRKYYEATTLAQAIDAFRAEGIGAEFEGMEILARRLAGLQMANDHKDDTFLEAMAWRQRSTVVPSDLVRTYIKDVERRNKLRPKHKNKWRRDDRPSQPRRKQHGPPSNGDKKKVQELGARG